MARTDEVSRRLLRLLEHVPVTLVEFRPDGTHQTVNHGLDVPFAALHGAARLQSSCRRVVASGAGEDLEVDVPDTGGRMCRVRCRLRPLPDGGAVLVAHELVSDVDLTRGLSLFGVLAASVAHDINNPLAAAIANLDLALASLRSGTTDVSEELGDARDAAERVRLILRDLRMFSGNDSATTAEIDVAFVVQCAVRVGRNVIGQRARLVERYGESALVEATDTRLAQAILIVLLLVGQAIPEGRARESEVQVSVDKLGDRVAVVVSASVGGDLSPLDPALGAVRQTVDALGGRLEVEGSEQQPPRVRLELPCQPLTEELAGVTPAAASTSRRGRILSIDDEPTIGMTVRRILGDAHEVVCLASAEAALSLLGHGERFDVLLCDVMMPGMTGIELFEVLTRDYPDQAERVIFLTGGAHSARASAFLKTSGVPRIDKPFDFQALREIVNRRVS